MPISLMRVPIGFDWPVGKIWDGYAMTTSRLRMIPEIAEKVPEIMDFESENACDGCREAFGGCDEGSEHCIFYNDRLRELSSCDPPGGDGYQVWEFTTEGSPMSPVFADLGELCEWCEEHPSEMWGRTRGRAEWLRFLLDNQGRR